jgi:hypothetical protein
MEISETTRKMKQVYGDGIDTKMFLGWFLWNSFVGLCFAGFIIAYYVSPAGEDKLPCSVREISDKN